MMQRLKLQLLIQSGRLQLMQGLELQVHRLKLELHMHGVAVGFDTELAFLH